MLGWALIVIVAAICLAAALAAARQPRRFFRVCGNSQISHFCNENGSAVNAGELRPRAMRPRIRRLSEEDRCGFLQVWDSVRRRFSSEPGIAVVYADLLISDLIQDCACLADAAENGAETLLEDRLRNKYVVAHQIALHNKREHIEPGELQEAMKLYAAVFDELLAEPRERTREDAGAGRMTSARRA